jgi:hypothetical protein
MISVRDERDESHHVGRARGCTARTRHLNKHISIERRHERRRTHSIVRFCPPPDASTLRGETQPIWRCSPAAGRGTSHARQSTIKIGPMSPRVAAPYVSSMLICSLERTGGGMCTNTLTAIRETRTARCRRKSSALTQMCPRMHRWNASWPEAFTAGLSVQIQVALRIADKKGGGRRERRRLTRVCGIA